MMQHVLFIHSSIGEHLGCFYFLTTIDIDTMNTYVQDFMLITTILGRY
jgi:hypothetical protein